MDYTCIVPATGLLLSEIDRVKKLILVHCLVFGRTWIIVRLWLMLCIMSPNIGDYFTDTLVTKNHTPSPVSLSLTLSLTLTVFLVNNTTIKTTITRS